MSAAKRTGVHISVAIDRELDEWVTLYAEQRLITRADAVRELLWASLYMSSAYTTSTIAAARANGRAVTGRERQRERERAVSAERLNNATIIQGETHENQ